MRNTRSKDSNEPFARLVASWAAIIEKDLDRAKSEADIALSLNPNFAGAYVILGHIQTLSGRPLEAIPALERATRLDPAFRPQHLHFLGMAYLLAAKYETAAALLRERILLMPETDFGRVLLASALGHLGEVEEARARLERTQRDQSKILIQQTFRPATFQEGRGRPADCRGSHESRNCRPTG